MKNTLLTLGITAFLMLGLQGCGGDSRPSKDDLSSTLEDKTELEGSVASCTADFLLDSDLSDKQLSAVADDNEEGLSTDEKAEVVEVIGAAVSECLTQ